MARTKWKELRKSFLLRHNNKSAPGRRMRRNQKRLGSDKVKSGRVRRNIKLNDDQLQWIMDWNCIFGRIFSVDNWMILRLILVEKCQRTIHLLALRIQLLFFCRCLSIGSCLLDRARDRRQWSGQLLKKRIDEIFLLLGEIMEEGGTC